MIKNLLFFILFNLIFSILLAQKPIPDRPKLIIGIIVEGLRYDILMNNWDLLSEKGFKKIYKSGLVYENAYYQYVNINNASSLASISTGVYPALNGIINDYWFDKLTKEKVNCVEDNKYKIIGIGRQAIGFSPLKIIVPAWTDYLKLNNFNQSKVISISLDPQSAVLLAGKKTDGVYWFDNVSGNWVSSDYYSDSLKKWVKKFNKRKYPDVYLETTWATSYPLKKYVNSMPDENSYELGFKGNNSFPYDMKEIKQLYPDYEILKFTPFGNTLTKDFALSAIAYEKLGKDDYTDVLYISFASLKYIARIFGIRSVEYTDALIKLDKDIAHLLSNLEQSFGFGKFLLFVTSDKGSCDYPIWLQDVGFEVNYFNNLRTKVVLNSYLRAIYGLKNWVEFIGYGNIYLNSSEIDKNKLSYEDLENRISQFITEFSGIYYSLPAVFLEKNDYSEGLNKKIKNSFCPERSGDVLFVLKDNWFIKNNGNGHNPTFSDCQGVWNQNAHVPLMLYGWKISPQKVYDKVDPIKLTISLAKILNVELPYSSENQLIEINKLLQK